MPGTDVLNLCIFYKKSLPEKPADLLHYLFRSDVNNGIYDVTAVHLSVSQSCIKLNEQ